MGCRRLKHLFRDVHAIGHPVLSLSGELVELVGTGIDVTERKRAEEERERLRQAHAKLARVNRITTMGKLTASLAHELNQPIAAGATNARSCVRWLAREHPDLEEACAAAMRVVKDVTRASEIISRIRVLFNKGTPDREWVDVNPVIGEDGPSPDQRGRSTQHSSPDGTGRGSPQGHGGPRASTASVDESHDQRHRCNEGHEWGARTRRQVAAIGQ